jgi:hypothetical protein
LGHSLDMADAGDEFWAQQAGLYPPLRRPIAGRQRDRR